MQKGLLCQKMLSELKSGDEVVTSGGIFATVTNVKEDRRVKNKDEEVAETQQISVVTKNSKQDM